MLDMVINLESLFCCKKNNTRVSNFDRIYGACFAIGSLYFLVLLSLEV